MLLVNKSHRGNRSRIQQRVLPLMLTNHFANGELSLFGGAGTSVKEDLLEGLVESGRIIGHGNFTEADAMGCGQLGSLGLGDGAQVIQISLVAYQIAHGMVLQLLQFTQAACRVLETGSIRYTVDD